MNRESAGLRADRPRMQGVKEAIEERRSVRSFRPGILDEPTVRELLGAAVLAPTARHLEPWAFVIVQDRALLKRISDRAIATWPPLPAPDHERQAAAHLPPASHAPGLLAAAELNVFYDAGTLIVICARPLGPFVNADCWLAAENLMLAATGLGLGTCCIGSAVEALNAPDLKAELGIPPDVLVVAPVIVGVPETVPAPTPRKAPIILSWK